MKQIIIGVVAALAINAMAETTNTVEVTKFHQSHPYTGKATVEYTIGGTLPENAFAEIIINTDDASATFTNETVVTGDNSNVIDFASSFGGARVLTNASYVVTIGKVEAEEEELGAVQLWADGPYWAACNVGATKPEDYGYYFWWGDTVGYTNNGSAWVSSADGTTTIAFSSTDGTAASTYGKDNDTLYSEGWIDETGNLMWEHDAATAHLGAPWRMPTSDEIQALFDNCTAEWTTRNGVNGFLFTGKGDYSDRRMFLPAAYFGYDCICCNIPGVGGLCCWSSTAENYQEFAYSLCCEYGGFFLAGGYRYWGGPVRPVRD